MFKSELEMTDEQKKEIEEMLESFKEKLDNFNTKAVKVRKSKKKKVTTDAKPGKQ